MTTEENTKPFRRTASVVGVLSLAGFVIGIGGIMLIQSILSAPNYLATVSANSMLLTIGGILWLLAVAGDAAHRVLLFPILKQHRERIAVGYLAASDHQSRALAATEGRAQHLRMSPTWGFI